MRNSSFLWIIVAILAVLDIYVFQAVKTVSQSVSPRIRIFIYWAYWALSVSSLLLLILLPFLNYENWPKLVRTYLFATIVGLFFAKLIASLFFLLDDVRRAAMWLIGKLFSNPSVEISQTAEGITRSEFLSWFGLVAGGTLLDRWSMDLATSTITR